MADLAPGTEIAGCRIEAVAGRGGMGVIYRATDVRLGRPVAVKLIAADRAADDAFRERFERESRLTAAIDHPNVIPVYAAGEEDGVLYLVMRYVAGTDLRALLEREGRLAPERAAGIVAQVAAGLDAAHAAGLAHRDVKPANVLIADGEHVYLSDFGIVRLVDADTRLTDSGEWVGTVDFMSPEHLEGRETDARSDVYALGCMLHAALTGRPPFRRDTVAATITAHLRDTPPRPSDTPGVPAEFDRMIARALAKRPEDRYPSAGDLGRAALAAARSEPITEEERSVARGPAAPASPSAVRLESPERPVRPSGAAAMLAPAAEAPTSTTPTRFEPATRIHSPPPPPSRVHRAPRRTAVIVLAAILGLGAAGAAVGILAGRGDDANSGPLSEGEVRSAVDGFARAYSNESVAGLRRVLAPNVKRIVPGDSQSGRRAVVEEYRRQFATSQVTSYRLRDLDVSGGDAGRATGSYEVSRRNRPPITGDIVFGVVRQAGTPRIALIAAEPTS
jgi:serine/threonine protein kinase